MPFILGGWKHSDNVHLLFSACPVQDGCSVALHPSTATAMRLRPVANKWNYGSGESDEGRKQLRSTLQFLLPFTLLALSFSSAVLSSAFPFLAGGWDETNCVIFVPPSHLSPSLSLNLSLTLSGQGAHPRSRGSTMPLLLLILLLPPHLPSLIYCLPRPLSIHPNPFIPGLTPPILFSCHPPRPPRSLFWKRQRAEHNDFGFSSG